MDVERLKEALKVGIFTLYVCLVVDYFHGRFQFADSGSPSH